MQIRVGKLWPVGQIQLIISFNKVLLEHSHALSFIYYLWLFLCQDGRVEQLPEYGPQNQNKKIFTIWHFTEVCQPLVQTKGHLKLCPILPKRKAPFIPRLLYSTHGHGSAISGDKLKESKFKSDSFCSAFGAAQHHRVLAAAPLLYRFQEFVH